VPFSDSFSLTPKPDPSPTPSSTSPPSTRVTVVHTKPDADPKTRGCADALIGICIAFVLHRCHRSGKTGWLSSFCAAVALHPDPQCKGKTQQMRHATCSRAQPQQLLLASPVGTKASLLSELSSGLRGPAPGAQCSVLPWARAGVTRRGLASGGLGEQAQLWERQEQQELNRSSCHTKCFRENKSHSKRKAGFLTNTFQQI